jgi:hypothetical protein
MTQKPFFPQHLTESARRKADSGAARGSVACGVITELNLLRDWIKDGSGYNRDDAPDEIARAIANRIREIEARESTMPPNAKSSHAGLKAHD